MLVKVLCVAALAALALAAPHHEHVEAQMSFDDFKAAFGKVYATQEEHDKRAAIFAANLEFIRTHNADTTQTYQVGVNQFADMTNAEYRQTLSPFQRTRALDVAELPAATADSVDWRTQNAVTPIKNQGQCGSCWSFSTTGSVEGASAIANKQLVSLSEQQLMDCSTAEGDQGCNGGLMDYAFEYIIKNGGLDTEGDYPYTARDGTCDAAKAAKKVVTITSYKDVAKDSDAALAAAASLGPVSVAIEADQSGFQMYKSGVFSGPCGTQLDHGVLVVGFTPTYWIVKNSWGTTWGDQGYIMMSRAVTGAGICGILSAASYPIAGSPGPSPPPSPPGPPSPPSPPSSSHYEDPLPGNTCQSDEEDIQIDGVTGSFCAPSCGILKACPTDVPTGTTARPECVLEKQGSTRPTLCALICTPGAEAGSGGCPTNASCKPIQTVGVCTYDS